MELQPARSDERFVDEVDSVLAAVQGVLQRTESDVTDVPCRQWIVAVRRVIHGMQEMRQQRTPEEVAESLAARLRQLGWRAMPPHGWEMRHPKCTECGDDAVWVCHMQFAGSVLFCDQHAGEEPDFKSSKHDRFWGLIAEEQDAAMANFLRELAGETFPSAVEAEAKLREVPYNPGELDSRVLPDNFRENAYLWALSSGWVQSDGRSIQIRDPKPLG
jgi:hypothetical protein